MYIIFICSTLKPFTEVSSSLRPELQLKRLTTVSIEWYLRVLRETIGRLTPTLYLRRGLYSPKNHIGPAVG